MADQLHGKAAMVQGFAMVGRTQAFEHIRHAKRNNDTGKHPVYSMQTFNNIRMPLDLQIKVCFGRLLKAVTGLLTHALGNTKC
ncbi:hypothetical protein GOP47_0030246 [Adiantum capillus-veneris]|nr:hypothetical protein GOP47_0030246 [Adiantum capillus-veneris]